MQKVFARAMILGALVSTTAAATAQTVRPDDSQFTTHFSGRSENLPMKNNVGETGSVRTAWFGHAVQHILAADSDAEPAVAGMKEIPSH